MFDKTELFSAVSVLKIILLNPTVSFLHCELHVWKFSFTLELCHEDISGVIHDAVVCKCISQKLRFFFKTNKHTNQGNLLDKWASVLLKLC